MLHNLQTGEHCEHLNDAAENSKKTSACTMNDADVNMVVGAER